ncbi:MAG: GlsB/YeaQ/YmgE family stress response membrane protein [Mycobacterium sp.]
MGTIIGTIVFGALIGVLARVVLPGKQSIGWLITIVLGVAGALIGYWAWGLIASEGNVDTGGVDWIRWAISIAAAAVLTLGYTAATKR